MLYKIGDKEYTFSYNELKEKHKEMCKLNDISFFQIDNLIDATHLACMIGYLKELNREATISDEGIIHQLIHAINCVRAGYSPEEYGIDLIEIRESFEETLKLS